MVLSYTTFSLSPSLCLCQSVDSGSSRTVLLLRISLIFQSLHLFGNVTDKKSIRFVVCFARLLVYLETPFSKLFFLSLPLSVSYLCFESSSSRSGSSKKNKVIKLVDITDIQKVIISNVDNFSSFVFCPLRRNYKFVCDLA